LRGNEIPSSCSKESKGAKVPEAKIMHFGFSFSICLKAIDAS